MCQDRRGLEALEGQVQAQEQLPDELRGGREALERGALGDDAQEHRDGDLSLMHYIMNGEYAGFFDIGMVQRNEHNAIIVHGTMCLIRRAAMDMAGGWAGDTICEDTDLGLAIIEHAVADVDHTGVGAG